MPNVSHQVDTAGTAKLIVKLPQGVYVGDVATATGVSELTGAPPAGSIAIGSVEAVMKGLIGSVRVTVLDGTKRRTRRLIVSLEKMDTVVAELPGKLLGALTILSARFPTRRRLR
ncbi:MAG TPA: hypothetical protein VK211_22150 [Kamptonema sp.]|nr:hypothetical protein [Kamptonema sp.]